MKKQVLITVKNTQEVDGQTDSGEMTTTGELWQEEDRLTLRYREVAEDEEIETTVTLDGSADPPPVRIARIGETESRMTVEQGKRHHSIYNLGPCEFALGVYGETVCWKPTPQGGTLTLQYTMDMNAVYAGRSTVQLLVTAAE